MFKKARPARPQQVMRRIVLPYVESRREARTPLAAFFSIPTHKKTPPRGSQPAYSKFEGNVTRSNGSPALTERKGGSRWIAIDVMD